MNKFYKITEDKIKGVEDGLIKCLIQNEEMSAYDKTNGMEYL